eukprot:SAG22_NODE_1708_length_3768_cov_2.094576_1_plen_157_part_00
MGDDLVNVVVGQFVNMPIWVMMGQLCPPGVEGSVFALVTSLQMVGATMSGTVSALLTAGLGITLEDFSMLPALTLLTAGCKLTALPFVVLAPGHIRETDHAAVGTGDETAETHKQVERPAQKSTWFGAFGLALALGAGIVWSVGTAVYQLVSNQPS